MLIPVLITGLIFWLSSLFWVMSALTLNSLGMFAYGLTMIVSGVALKVFIKG